MALHTNDRYLVESCIRRDLNAWAVFVKKYSGLIHISIKNRLKKYGISATSHEMEDIKQDIFSDIWANSKLSTIRNRDDISYWIAIISGNAAAEHFRSKDRRNAFNAISLSDKIKDAAPEDVLHSTAPGPMDELNSIDISTRIGEAIESLPSQEKLMIKLSLLHGKKHSEIAEFLSVPKGTVSSYIKRAKDKLKDLLKNLQ